MPLDLDSIFAYTTVKTVKIRDRYLGILHYAAMVGIFLYIVVFTVILEKGYLYVESPVGSTRFSFRRPYLLNGSAPNPTNPDNLDYCLTPGKTNIQTIIQPDDECVVNGVPLTGQNLMCIYYDEDDAVYPSAESNAIMLTTRVTTQVYTLPGCSLLDYTCDYVELGPETNYFVADADDFTLLIDHAMRAPISGKQRNGKFINGKLLRDNGKSYPMEYLEKGIERIAGDVSSDGSGDFQPTILKLRTVLAAAGIGSTVPGPTPTTLSGLDRPSDSEPACDETYRYTGLVVVLFIRYDNKYSYNENRIRYTLQFQVLAETEYKVNQEVFLNPSYNATSQTYDISTTVNNNRHGVRIIAVILGEIGHFEFQTLLITLVSGMGLLAVATLIVDFLATTILPNKQMYDVYKTQYTVDFSDLKNGRVALPPEIEREKGERYDKKTRSESNGGL